MEVLQTGGGSVKQRGAYAMYMSQPDVWLHTVIRCADGWATAFRRGASYQWTTTTPRYGTAQEAQAALDTLAEELTGYGMKMEKCIISAEPVPRI